VPFLTVSSAHQMQAVRLALMGIISTTATLSASLSAAHRTVFIVQIIVTTVLHAKKALV
jgi:hypothetical protein